MHSSGSRTDLSRTPRCGRWLAFSLTFFSYATYCFARTPYSVCKSTLASGDSGWAPLQSSAILGALDSVFLFSYSICQFGAGWLADRYTPKLILCLGMVGSGVSVALFGFGFFFKTHSLYFFIVASIINGAFQSSGWPCNVAILSQWFDKQNRGTVMGWWDAHASVGNVAGKVLLTLCLQSWGWQYAFIVAGAGCTGVGILELVALQSPTKTKLRTRTMTRSWQSARSSPYGQPFELNIDSDYMSEEDANIVGFNSSHSDLSSGKGMGNVVFPSAARGTLDGYSEIPVDNPPIVHPRRSITNVSEGPISFFAALCLPGVLAFSSSLFFAKFAAYAFYSWLPYYLNTTVGFSVQTSSNISTAYDVGGVLGGVLTGWISDRLNARRGTTAMATLLLAVPALFFYSRCRSTSLFVHGGLLLLSGMLVNGPYSLISSSVSADLALQPALIGRPSALSSITGIVSGHSKPTSILKSKF